MKRALLTKNEEKTLYGLTRYPEMDDSELSSTIQVKLSTLTSIKRRLTAQGIYRTLMIPMVNRVGCELLGVIHTQFNPVIPLQKRIQTTKKNIEIYDEIFLSVGEQDKGFSISLSRNYTMIGRINEIRTETFGKLGLLEKEYPHEVIFPFPMSHITRFFDYSRLLKRLFSLEHEKDTAVGREWFHDNSQVQLSGKERKVFTALVAHPEATTQQIGDLVGFSRHTISRMKTHFFETELLKQIIVPDLKRLGIELLTFYHIKFNPHHAPTPTHIAFLDSPFTILLAHRKFELVLLAAYPTFEDYKQDEIQKIRFLKENDLISIPPVVGTYMINHMVVIKDFDFVSLTKKILLQTV